MTNDQGRRPSAAHVFVRAVDRLNGAVGRVTTWLVLAMTVAGAAAALLRYLARPLGIAPALNALGDLQWMLFSGVFLLGAAWALRDDAHVRVDVLYARRTERGRAWTDLLGSLALLLPFCVLLAWTLWPAVERSLAIREGALDPGGLARWPVRLVILPAVALLALQGLAQAVRAALVLLGRPVVDALPPTPASGTP